MSIYYSINDLVKIKTELKNERKTIMLYFWYWDFYGTARVLSILIINLVKKYNIILVSNSGNGFSLPSEVKHIRLDTLNENETVDNLLFIALELSVDLFIGQPNVSGAILKSYKKFRDKSIKTIACNHENYFRALELYMLQTYRNKELNNANVVTWLTNYFNTIYSVFNSNGIVMYNPLPFEISRFKHIQNNNIICVGDFTRIYKRIDLIIEIFSKILKRKSDVELYIVGDYQSEEVSFLLEKFNIPSLNVHLIGCIDDVSKYYESASVLLMTSDTEGFSMVLVEAGSFGIPSVILEIPGLEDVITNGKNGFIFNRDDLDGMADKVVELLSNKELYDFMSQNSLDMVKRFSVDTIIERWDNLIQCVLNTEKQDDLNKLLRDKFSLQNLEQNIDKDVYVERLIRQYEGYFSNAILKCKDKIDGKDARIKILNEQIKTKNEIISKRDEVIKTKNEAISKRDEVIKTKNETISKRDEVIKTKNECIKQKNNEIQKLHTQNKKLYTQTNLQEQVIKRLQNSWSYRIGRLFIYPLSIPLDFYRFIRDYNLIKKSSLFDSEYYLLNNEDVKNAKMNPIKHYLKFGWKEGRNPSEKFNGNEYLNKRPDVRVSDICPLVHFLKFGKNEDLSFLFEKAKNLESKNKTLENKNNNILTENKNLAKKINEKSVEFEQLNRKKSELDIKFFESTKNFEKLNKKVIDLEKFKSDIQFIYYRGINKEKVSYEIEQFLKSLKSGITDEKREYEIIVSLTSYPARIHEVYYTIFSLLTQSLKPNKVILWLGDDKFPNKDKDLPKNLLQFTECGLTIKYTKDLRSYTKLVPTLKEYPNALIVTADDDLFYFDNWLEKLYNCWKDNKDCIICHRVAIAELTTDKQFVQFNDWKQPKNILKASLSNCLLGYCGTLYPPNSLYKDVLNEKIFKKLAPNADDIYFWAMAVLNDTKIKLLEDSCYYPIYVNPVREKGFNSELTLFKSNGGEENKNQIQFDNIIKYYPQITEKLLNE